MTLERGFRRITAAVSLLALIVGLGLSPTIVHDWRERGREAEVLDRSREIRDDVIGGLRPPPARGRAQAGVQRRGGAAAGGAAAPDATSATLMARARTAEDLAQLRNNLTYQARSLESLTPSEATAFDLDRGAISFEQLNDAGQALVRAEWPFLVPLAPRDALLYQLGTGAVDFPDLSAEQRRLIGLERPRWEVAELWSLRLALAVALSLLPWVLFYVVRWIAKGFMVT